MSPNPGHILSDRSSNYCRRRAAREEPGVKISRAKRLWCRILAIFALLVAVFRPYSLLAAENTPAAKAQSGSWGTFEKVVRPFFEKHCFECHDQTKSGDVRLDEFGDEKALIAGVGTIDRAAMMLKRHAMPPKKKMRPAEEEITPVLAWMNGFIARMDRELPTNPGRVVIRRLNRTEYNNTVRDLLGVDFRPDR